MTQARTLTDWAHRSLEQIAGKLAGRPVRLRMNRRAPNLLGLAQKDKRGQAVIDIAPELLAPDEIWEFLRVFLHETAHVKLHLSEISPRDIDAPANVAVLDNHRRHRDADYSQLSAEEILVAAKVKQREREANELASKWLEPVRNNLLGYMSVYSDPVVAAIRVLQDELLRGRIG